MIRDLFLAFSGIIALGIFYAIVKLLKWTNTFKIVKKGKPTKQKALIKQIREENKIEKKPRKKQSMLTAEQVLEIYCSKESHKPISLKFNITDGTVKNIKSGKTHANITKHEGNKLKNTFQNKEDDVKKCYLFYAKGDLSGRKTSKAFGFGKDFIKHLLKSSPKKALEYYEQQGFDMPKLRSMFDKMMTTEKLTLDEIFDEFKALPEFSSDRYGCLKAKAIVRAFYRRTYYFD